MPHILLVEDDDQLRTMLKVILRGSGYDVLEAHSGTGVCDVYQQQHFDLVITDLLMPDKEGLELIMELRRIDPNVRIIAMSGGGQGNAGSYLQTARTLGAQHTLSKPFSGNEFLETIRLALESEPEAASLEVRTDRKSERNCDQT